MLTPEERKQRRREKDRRYRQSGKGKERDRRLRQKYRCAPKWAWEFGGETAAKIYVVWRGMIIRATVKTPAGLRHNPWYANCTVCDEWRDFKNFYFWSLANGWKPNPKKRQTIDRIDNEKGYCPANCRWVNWSVQMKNRRMTEKWREACRRNWQKARAVQKAKREARILIQMELFGG